MVEKSSTVTKIWEKNKDLARSNTRDTRDLGAEFIELDHDLEQIMSETVPGAGISGRAARGSAFRKATCGPASRRFHSLQGHRPALSITCFAP
jgi:hypothetical protein